MSSIKKADPQQRMTNMLLAGNLYKSHKIDKGIQKISQIQQAAMKQNMQMHQQTMAQNREIIANIVEKIIKEQETIFMDSFFKIFVRKIQKK